MEFILKILGCLIAAGLIGLVVGWLLGRLRNAGPTKEEKESWEAKLRSSERDLDKVRGELKTYRDQVSGLKSDLATSTDRLKLRDSEYGELEAKLKAFLPLEATLAAKSKELESATAELGALRLRLTEAEAQLKKPAQPDPQLINELNTVKQNLAGKDTEIATLLARVKELAPLGLQIKDRDLRLRDWEAKYNDAVKAKDGEIGALKTSLMGVEEKLGGLQSSLAGKDSEIQMLQARIGDLGPLQEKLAELQTSLAGKDSEIQMLQARTGDLGPLQEEITGLKMSLSGKDSEIQMLQARASDLGPLQEKIAELQASLSGKDSEIQMLQARTGDLGPLQAQLSDCGAKLREAESKLLAQASNADAEAEIATLRSRVRDLEIMHIRAVTPPPPEEQDDLEPINGVGPVLAKMLNRLGIYTFKQVAMWNKEQIEWVDRQLEHFHGRIERENWVESAKEEHFKKYGERL